MGLESLSVQSFTNPSVEERLRIPSLPEGKWRDVFPVDEIVELPLIPHSTKIEQATQSAFLGEAKTLRRFYQGPELTIPIAIHKDGTGFQTLADVIWQNLEVPGQIIQKVSAVSEIEFKDIDLQAAFFQARIDARAAYDHEHNIPEQSDLALLEERMLLALTLSVHRYFPEKYLPFKHHQQRLLRDHLKELRLILESVDSKMFMFNQQWNKRMTVTPFQLMSSFSSSDQLNFPILPHDQGQDSRVLSEVILGQALYPFTISQLEKMLKSVTQQEWVDFILQRDTLATDRSVRVALLIKGTNGKNVFSHDEFLEELQANADSPVSQYYLKAQICRVYELLTMAEKHVEAFRKQSDPALVQAREAIAAL